MSKKSRLKQKQPHNIFDNVFHTLATKMPRLIIPVINFIYALDIPSNAEIIQLRNEFYEKKGMFITDSIYLIAGRIFHFECQSLADPTMAIRMFRYDTDIAIEYADKAAGKYWLKYPASAVIYLRPGTGTNSHAVDIGFYGESDIRYHTAAVNVQDYTKEDIFEKKLFLFLPFYIMRYEKTLDKHIYDKAWIDALLCEFTIIRDRLYEELPKDRRLCNDIFALTIQISDYILRNHRHIRERMRKIMGGEILELYSERMARFEKEIAERATKSGMAKGMAEGMAQGLSQGLSQGISQSLSKVITNMLNLNMPFDTIQAVTGYSYDEILNIKNSL